MRRTSQRTWRYWAREYPWLDKRQARRLGKQVHRAQLRYGRVIIDAPYSATELRVARALAEQ